MNEEKIITTTEIKSEVERIAKELENNDFNALELVNLKMILIRYQSAAIELKDVFIPKQDAYMYTNLAKTLCEKIDLIKKSEISMLHEIKRQHQQLIGQEKFNKLTKELRNKYTNIKN